jgi:ribonuclease VapC
MIVVDSSALIAILFDEPEKQAFENVIASGERCVMSAVNAHETALAVRVKRGGSRRAVLAVFDRRRD